MVEVGYGDKGFKQAVFTLNRIKGNYGFIVSFDNRLELNSHILKLPINYFLLI